MTDTQTNERLVKFRQVTYWDEIPNNVTPNGEPVLVERTAAMGERINLRPQDEERLDSLGALYTADDETAIENGTYAGPEVDVLRMALTQGITQGVAPPPRPGAPQDIGGEGPQVSGTTQEGVVGQMSTEQLADYIKTNRLTVDQTAALATDGDVDSINRVLDAENLASENDPRRGVTDRLEAKLTAATKG